MEFEYWSMLLAQVGGGVGEFDEAEGSVLIADEVGVVKIEADEEGDVVSGCVCVGIATVVTGVSVAGMGVVVSVGVAEGHV